MADPYAAWVHLPPADLSDLDPRFAVERWDETLYYEDMGERLSRAGEGNHVGGGVTRVLDVGQPIAPSPADDRRAA